MSIQIFVMTHKAFTPPNDPLYRPLHVGHINAPDLGFQGDDTGDHISEKNCYYAELSGMYWVYKNFHETDYVGICHYRRYLINIEGRVFTSSELENILLNYDIITTKTLELRSNYYDGFGENHNKEDLFVVERILKQKYPDDYKIYEKLVHENRTYFGNICMMSKKLYDCYCEWLFDIFFEAEKYLDLSHYDRYQMRFFGFVSEFLLYVWVKARNLRAYECMVGMIGEKVETRECKEKLAAFFAKKDYLGAKNYFLTCREKRPDILMEASDVTGELRQCMQVIAICEYEYDAYQTTILEKTNDFTKIMEHISIMNRIVNRILLGTASAEDFDWIKESRLSKIAWEVTVSLFCKEETLKTKTLYTIEQAM